MCVRVIRIVHRRLIGCSLGILGVSPVNWSKKYGVHVSKQP